MRFSLRRYCPDDAEGTWRAFDEAVSRTAASYYTPAQITAWNPGDVDLNEWNVRRAAAWSIVVDADGEIAGFSDLTADGELDMLYIHPDFGRRGVARALVTAVPGEARRRGLDEVRTRASRAARPAFERFGFVTDRENAETESAARSCPTTTCTSRSTLSATTTRNEPALSEYSAHRQLDPTLRRIGPGSSLRTPAPTHPHMGVRRPNQSVGARSATTCAVNTTSERLQNFHSSFAARLLEDDPIGVERVHFAGAKAIPRFAHPSVRSTQTSLVIRRDHLTCGPLVNRPGTPGGLVG